MTEQQKDNVTKLHNYIPKITHSECISKGRKKKRMRHYIGDEILSHINCKSNDVVIWLPEGSWATYRKATEEELEANQPNLIKISKSRNAKKVCCVDIPAFFSNEFKLFKKQAAQYKLLADGKVALLRPKIPVVSEAPQMILTTSEENVAENNSNQELIEMLKSMQQQNQLITALITKFSQ